MKPMQHNGGHVVYVWNHVKGDDIYVLAVKGELLIKQLQFDKICGKLRIINDNNMCRPMEISLEGLDNVWNLGKVLILVYGEV